MLFSFSLCVLFLYIFLFIFVPSRLSEMSVPWSGLPETVRNEIEQLLLRTMKKNNSEDISSINVDDSMNSEISLSSFLNGSSQMKFNWRENEKLKNAVFEYIQRSYQREQLDSHRVTGTQLVNTLVQLSGMRWKINDTPKDALKSLLDAIEHPSTVFTTFQICNLMRR
jgi:hypothetical protein